MLLLAGTWHVGSPVYYAELARLLERADLVLSETVRAPRDTARGERTAPDDLVLVWRYQRAIAAVLGWRLQADWERSIADERWQPLDLSWREQADALGDAVLLSGAQRAAIERWEAFARGEASPGEIHAAREALRTSMGRDGPLPPPRWEEARNDAIFAGLRRVLDEGSARTIVLLHGPAHLRALAPRLEAELGYAAEAACWMRVGDPE